MMHKTNSNRWMMTKAVVLPTLMALAVVAFAKPKVEETPATENENTTPVVAEITTPTEVKPEVSLQVNNDSIYEKVEKEAEFPGGLEAMYKWIGYHLKYPEECRAKSIQGRVTIQFVINKDGSISEIKTLRSPNPLLSKEGIRIVNAMPKWKPAQNKGKVVASYFRLPISFRLAGTQKTETITEQGAQIKPVVLTAVSKPTGKPVEETADDGIFDEPETKAEFPGGLEAMYKWIGEHLKYPEECKAKGIQGRVTIQFVVNKDGSIPEIKTLRSPNPLLSDEAIRVVKAMPKWKPAQNKGKAVRSRFRLPINFRIPDTEKKVTITGQGKPSGEVTTITGQGKPSGEVVDDNVSIIHETDAEFPGGLEAMYKWIADQLKYPEECIAKNIQGRVTTQFVVDIDGSITDIKVLKSPDDLLSQEAIRIVKAMPKWKPATYDSKPVRRDLRIPLNFRLPPAQTEQNPKN